MVAAPNAMWHVDGNHKLIRWRLVIHAGVDGFSRTVVFIKCANNNKSVTVLEAFRMGVSQFGIPDCVRSDHGGENVGRWRYMLEVHPGNDSCVLMKELNDYGETSTGVLVSNIPRYSKAWKVMAFLTH